jgi:hypothetical protein
LTSTATVPCPSSCVRSREAPPRIPPHDGRHRGRFRFRVREGQRRRLHVVPRERRRRRATSGSSCRRTRSRSPAASNPARSSTPARSRYRSGLCYVYSLYTEADARKFTPSRSARTHDAFRARSLEPGKTLGHCAGFNHRERHIRRIQLGETGAMARTQCGWWGLKLLLLSASLAAIGAVRRASEQSIAERSRGAA